uniref:Uncharacterized protein n=1 Tax=Fusarium oxysporum (strain Fo5176) TaxID=660025 RepID=A0A0D2X8Y2_FUSOF
MTLCILPQTIGHHILRHRTHLRIHGTPKTQAYLTSTHITMPCRHTALFQIRMGIMQLCYHQC